MSRPRLDKCLPPRLALTPADSCVTPASAEAQSTASIEGSVGGRLNSGFLTNVFRQGRRSFNFPTGESGSSRQLQFALRLIV